ncbi:MAG: DUF4258 domain-containing protein [Microbacteriaceae bacterium]|nr:DUF4258 domain-containing protein [Microbacteriaceae bacterium]
MTRWQVLPDAVKHGILVEDILHAIRNVMRYREHEYGGETRVLIIGPARDGRLLEVVVVPAGDPERVIHADALRGKFYEMLR